MENSNKTKIVNYLFEHALELFLGIPSIVAIYGYAKRIIANFSSSGAVTISKFELLLGVLVLTGMLLWITIFRHFYFSIGPGYPRAYLKSPYVIESLEIKYKRDSEGNTLLVKRMKIKSKTNGLDHINQKCFFTGEDKPKLPTGTIGIRNITPDKPLGIFNYFVLTLDETLTAGQEKVLEYEWPVISVSNSTMPFFGINTEYPTSNIKISIDLGPLYADMKAMVEEYRSIESEYPLSRDPISFDDEGKLIWDTKKAKRFRHYRIVWTWSDNDSTIAK